MGQICRGQLCGYPRRLICQEIYSGVFMLPEYQFSKKKKYIYIYCASTLLRRESRNKCYLSWMVARDCVPFYKLSVLCIGTFWWVLKDWCRCNSFDCSFSSPQYIFSDMYFSFYITVTIMCVGGERFNSDLLNSGSFYCSSLTLCRFGNFLHKIRIKETIKIK